MVILVKESLIDLHTKKSQLVSGVDQKIIANLINGLNDVFHKDYKIDSNELRVLLDSIETRIRKCQMINFLYFRTIDNSIVTGNATNLPFLVNGEFSYATLIVGQSFEANDRLAYLELINSNFQTFILAIASILENLVFLKEILVKKVILHKSATKPLNTPMATYLDFLKNLVKLGYRQQDPFYHCIDNHTLFFDKYLSTINILRNSFIHGYSQNTSTASGNCVITNFDQKQFIPSSAELEIENFVEIVLDNISRFTNDLFDQLIVSTQAVTVSIPA